MSLSSLLLKKSKVVDAELDALFKSAPQPRAQATAMPVPSASKQPKKSNKRKLVDEDEEEEPKEVAVTSPTKRLKSISSPKKGGEKEKAKKGTGKEEVVDLAKKPSTPAKSKKKAKKSKVEAEEDDKDEEDNNSDLENQYLKGRSTAQPRAPREEEGSESGSDAEVSDTGEELVHESLQKKKKSTGSAGKQKYVPAEETAEQRDGRTVFVGNLPIAVVQQRPLKKQLQRHVLTLVPSAKIESIRFRSVPFQAPTAKLPTSEDEGDGTSNSKSKSASTPTASSQRRQHDVERTTSWRTNQIDDRDEEVVKKDEKKFLNTNQKKKIAFINHELHTGADVVNAYIVFAHPVNQENRPANLPPPPATLDPYEAARLAVERCNGTLFMERVLRVDRVGKTGRGKVGGDAVEGEEFVSALLDADPKLSVFVGNLDFASKEEDLRVFFEGVVVAERGPPVEEEAQIADDNEAEVVVKKPNMWVTRVRIVRDKDTQLGKGFAYVQFADRECVDEVLALEEGKLKFAKRNLRVQRCKSLPGSSLKINTAASKKGGPVQPKAPAAAANIVIPRGDPRLGERLAHLSKDARKEAKSTDADRVARRLAKKKARMAMPPGSGGGKGKDRERIRKGNAKGRPEGANPGKKVSRGRVRSEKSSAKRNMKK